MKDAGSGGYSETGRLVERQMLLYHARLRAQREGPAERKSPRYRFLTISRDVGSMGDTIASELAAQLQWNVFDREIVDYIAQNSHVRLNMVQDLDETSRSLIHDTVDRLLRLALGGSFGKEEYREALLKTLAMLSAQGCAILVGHGGAFALAGQPGLHVRVTGSPEVRIARLSKRWVVPPEEAARRMLRIDAERRSFIQYHFKQTLDNTHCFDLVFNTDRLTVEQVAAAVMSALQEKEPVSVTRTQPRPSGRA